MFWQTLSMGKKHIVGGSWYLTLNGTLSPGMGKEMPSKGEILIDYTLLIRAQQRDRQELWTEKAGSDPSAFCEGISA